MPRLLALILACLLCSSLAAATAHPVSPLTYETSMSVSMAPLVATNGSTFVEVWASDSHAFASVFDGEGRLVTPHGQALPHVSSPSQLLSVGDDYLVISSNQFATIFTPSLEILRTFQLPAGRAAWNGHELIVVAFDDQVSARAAFFDLDGHLLTTAIVLTGAVANSDVLDVAGDGSDFAVLVNGRAGLMMQRVSATGTVGPQVTVSKDRASSVRMAADDGRLLIAWTVYTNVIEAAVVGANGLIVDPQAIPIDSGFTSLAAVAPYQDRFAVFSHVTPKPYASGRFVGWDIDVVADHLTVHPLSTNIAETPSRTITGVAVNGSVVLAVGSQSALETTPPPTAGAIAIRADDASAEPEVVSILPRPQFQPVVASDGIDFLVGWRESQMAFAPVDWRGTPLRPASMSGSFSSAPAVAFSGTQYLIVWSDSEGLKGSTIAPPDIVTGTFLIRATGGTDPAVTWDGRRFAVVWIERNSVYGTFVTLDGRVDAPRQVSLPDPESNYYAAVQPDIAWNGHAYLVGWTYFVGGIICGCPPPHPGAWLRLMDDTGSPFGPVVRLNDDAIRVHLASDGRDFLVVSEPPYSLRINPISVRFNQLSIGSSTTVFDWTDRVTGSVTFGGVDYVIAFTYGTLLGGGKSWLATAHRHADGSLSRPKVTDLAMRDSVESPSVAVNGANEVLAATSMIEPEIGSTRVYTFRESEFDELPPAPSPPRNVTAIRSRCAVDAICTSTVTWSGSAGDGGYVVERRLDSSTEFAFIAGVPGNVHETIVYGPFDAIRVRTIGAGGLSEATPALLIDPARRRSTRH